MPSERRPNAYYYRHLPPGEKQRNGAWTPEEKKLFLARMKEMRGDSDTFGRDWGLFSLAIPARVGYQCSNFYRLLIESGELTDSKYVWGEDGRIHHTSRTHDPKLRKKPTTAQKPRRTYQAEEVESFRLVQGGGKLEPPQEQPEETHRTLSRYETWALQNPLPNMIDYITGEVIRVPTMAPSGFVLDYNTWIESLAENPVDPFTRQRLNKRQLVVLTTENFHLYADKIRKQDNDM